MWHVLRVVPEADLPDWYAAQIRFLAQDHLRISWLGLYLATKEPVHQYDPRELSTWLHAPDQPGCPASCSTRPRWTRRLAARGHAT